VSAPMWGRGVRRYGRRARRAGQHLRRVASQAPEAARKAGRAAARQVASIQRAAGLEAGWRTRRLMERSFWSVVGDHGKGPAPSPEWRQGYAEQAVAMVPALWPAPREPMPPGPEPPRLDDPPPEPPARPTWPRGPAKGPEPEDPEAGS
jgi:hypothetical protein